MGEIKYWSKRQLLPLSILVTLLLAFLFFTSNLYAETVISGRYNISRNTTGVELETVTQSSCGKVNTSDTTTEGGCHLVNNRFSGYTSDTIGPGDTNFTDSIEETGIGHPGAGRDVAGFYPYWVHQRMGGTYWPTWDTPSVAPDTQGFPTTTGDLFGNMTEPWIANRRTGGQGNTDADIGETGSIDLGFNRTTWGDSAVVGRYLSDNFESRVGRIADPQGGSPYNNLLAGCSYGGTANEPGNQFGGCHGIYDAYPQGAGPAAVVRDDNISCTYCHANIIVNSTSQMAGKRYGHGTGGSPGADDCYDCHSDNFGPTNPTTDNLSGLFVPKIVWCTECHEATVNWNDTPGGGGKMGNQNFSTFLNPTFTHAGKDCRFCHGWGMNITREDYWNGTNSSGQATSTCGNNDNYCHGDSSTTRYVPPLTHGSQNYNVTCNDCHVNPAEPAHNITVPSCNKCHNSTGWSGNANDNSSTNAPVPNWDSQNQIYHGNTSRTYSPNPGKKCAECHVPNDITNLSKGFNTEGTPHNINASQNSGKNYIPSCQEIVCHGNSTDAPIDPDGSAINGTWIRESHASGLATSKPLECTDCHNNRTVTYWTTSYEINTSLHASYPSRIIPFNIERDSADGAVDKTICLNCHEFGALDCASCHSTDGVLIIHDADMDKPDAVIDGAHGAGGPNCVDSSCHDVGNTPSVNVSSMNNTNAMHYYLNNRSGDPGSQIGDGYTLCMDNSAGCINWNSQRCWACHGNGSQPANGTMSSANATAEGRGNYTNPYYCWDCHVVNYTSEGVLDWNGSQNAYNKYPYIKNVTEHIMEQYAPDIDTNTSYPLKNGTCQRCHNNSIGISSGSVPKSTGLPASLLANVSHYGQNDSLMTSNVNSTRCLYCHNDSANGSSWGGAPQIFDDTNGMYQANESQDCWYCHTDNSQQPENFHKPILNVITSKCELCHFKYKYFNSTRKSKFINETKFNESVHWNSSVIYCTDCHTNMSFGSARNETHPYQLEGAAFLPPESGWKWCEDCHVYQAPYPNETQQRHNITSEPQNYQVYNKTGDLQGVLDITDCTTCHDSTYYNNATATFNRTSGKDCRWCHTFPELTPASPY